METIEVYLNTHQIAKMSNEKIDVKSIDRTSTGINTKFLLHSTNIKTGVVPIHASS